MNFFKLKTTWSNAEFIPLKVCIGTAYILIGAYFHSFFREYYLIVIMIFTITMVWSLYLWINKMNQNKQNIVGKRNIESHYTA
jgi:hypothetical protein